MSYLAAGMVGLQGLGTFMKYSSLKREGEYAMGAARFDASQAMFAGAQEVINGETRANDRIAQFDSDMESNIALCAFKGRDVDADASINAFFDKQKNIAYTDTSRMANDGYIKLGQAKLRAKQAMYRGATAKASADYRATSAIINGAFGMAQTWSTFG